MPTILLIRHGESQSNAGLASTYPRNVELTQRGHEQARQIRAFLQTHARIITSPYTRSQAPQKIRCDWPNPFEEIREFELEGENESELKYLFRSRKRKERSLSEEKRSHSKSIEHYPKNSFERHSSRNHPQTPIRIRD